MAHFSLCVCTLCLGAKLHSQMNKVENLGVDCVV